MSDYLIVQFQNSQEFKPPKQPEPVPPPTKAPTKPPPPKVNPGPQEPSETRCERARRQREEKARRLAAQGQLRSRREAELFRMKRACS